MAGPVNNANAVGLSYDYSSGKYRSNVDNEIIPKDRIDSAIINSITAMQDLIRHQQAEIERLSKMVDQLFYPMRTRE